MLILAKVASLMTVFFGLVSVYTTANCMNSSLYCDYAFIGPSEQEFSSVSFLSNELEKGQVSINTVDAIFSSKKIVYKNSLRGSNFLTQNVTKPFEPLVRCYDNQTICVSLVSTSYDHNRYTNIDDLEFEITFIDLDRGVFSQEDFVCSFESYQDRFRAKNLRLSEKRDTILVDLELPCDGLKVNDDKSIGFASYSVSGTLIIEVLNDGYLGRIRSKKAIDLENDGRLRSHDYATAGRNARAQAELADEDGWLGFATDSSHWIDQDGFKRSDFDLVLFGKFDEIIVVENLSFCEQYSHRSYVSSENLAGYICETGIRYNYKSTTTKARLKTHIKGGVLSSDETLIEYELELPTHHSKVDIVGVEENSVELEIFADAQEVKIGGIVFPLIEKNFMGSGDGVYQGRFKVEFSETSIPVSFEKIAPS